MKRIICRFGRPTLALLAALALAGCSTSPAGPGSNGITHPDFVKVSSGPAGALGAQPVTALASVDYNFNGTAIPAGRTIWFSSVLKYDGPTNLPVTLRFDHSTIEFAAGSVPYKLNVPGAIVTFIPGLPIATTVYDPANNLWVTTAPFSFSGRLFVNGLAFPVTSDLPGGIKPVTWRGNFSSATSGVNVSWQCQAAVYKSFSNDHRNVLVKPVDGKDVNFYQNDDHAGTPENFKSFVTGGAGGGGGSNYTGSLSSTLVVVPALSTGSIAGSKLVSGARADSLIVGRFKLRIPAGAISGSATVSITVPDPTVLQCDLSINPGTANHFTSPVTLSSDFTGAVVADPTTLVEVWFDEAAQVWRVVPGSSVDVANSRVVAPLSHFSSYGVAQGKAGW